MKKIITICFAIFLGSLGCLKAEQLLGVNITYRNIGINKFEIMYKVFTDKYFQGKLDTAIFKPITFKIISGNATVTNYPLLFKIDSINTGCINNIKMNPIYFYIDTVDLNLSKYSSIISSGNCRTYFTCKYPERFRGLKNMSASSYFSYAFINICNSNSNTSAKNNSDPFINLCCNQPYFNNYSTKDETNFDSLSYSFIQPFKDFNSKISFSSGYSVNEQLDVYWPVGYDRLSGSNPKVNPPIGFFIDSSTGDLAFTPTVCNAQYSIASETIEHQKNGSKYLEVGGFLNDFVLKVNECPDNNPPLLFGPYKYEVEAGKQLCFQITSDDKPFIPPPPAKTAPPDTVRLTWNRGIFGATFTILDPKTRLQNGKFCWTSKVSQASDIPYIFTVTAKDNSCPTNGFIVRTYSIKLNKPVNYISNSNPQNIIISPNPSPNGELNISSNNFKFSEIALFDISGKLLANWNFEQTCNFSKDLSYLAYGIYYIKCKNGSEVFNFKWIRE